MNRRLLDSCAISLFKTPSYTTLPPPTVDEEYAELDGVLRGMDSEAANHIDLLSTLFHEFGHHLGLVDVEDLTKPLGGQLGIGVRRVDFSRDKLFADPDALSEVRS